MSSGIPCYQTECKNYAFYRFTWPGRDESAICLEHVGMLKATANALGMHLQTIPITPEEHANLSHPLATLEKKP